MYSSFDDELDGLKEAWEEFVDAVLAFLRRVRKCNICNSVCCKCGGKVYDRK